MPLDVLAVVQIDEHRRIREDAEQQVLEAAAGVRTQQLVLAEHHPGIAHLAVAGGEVAVPEQCQLLFEGAPGEQHALTPPGRQPLGLHGVRPQPVEELVDHRLEPPRLAFGQHLDAHRLAALAGDAHGLRPALWKRIHARIPDRRRIERRQVIRHRLIVDESVDNVLGGHVRESRDLLRGRAETGALDEMGRLRGVPIGRGDRGEVVRPGGRARALVPGTFERSGSSRQAEHDRAGG